MIYINTKPRTRSQFQNKNEPPLMCANLLYFYIAKIAHRDQAVVLGYSYYKTIYKIDLKS